MLDGIVTVARFTFREALRKKALLAALLLTFAYLALFAFGVSQLREATGQGNGLNAALSQVLATQVFTMGLYLASLLTTLLAAFAAVGAISGELESGTALALLTHPTSRTEIMLGKFLGYALMLSGYAALFFLALRGIMHWQGGLSAGPFWQPLGLFILQPLTMLAATFLGSAWLSTLGNGIAMFMLYGLAMAGGFLEQVGSLAQRTGGLTGLNGTALVNAGIVSSLLLPADALYRRAAYLLLSSVPGGNPLLALGPFGSISVPSLWMVVYAILYTVVLLALATRRFVRRDV